jgi:hypothetical protein
VLLSALVPRQHHRYWFALAVALAAVALHWMIIPFVGTRVPYLFLLIAVGITSFYAGRNPGLVVVAIGALNASFQLVPIYSLLIAAAPDRIALGIYLVTGAALAFGGTRLRELYDTAQKNVSDLERLHDLSLAVATLPALHDQLNLILHGLAEMHGTRQGLISIYDSATNRLRVVASCGFSVAGLEQLKNVRGGQGACGIACAEGRRVAIEDTEHDPRFADFRELARQEQFRSVHSTPLLSHAGKVLGAISVHCPAPRPPSTR